MISNHYASTFNHADAWLILALMLLAGALIKQFFVLWHGGWPPPRSGRALFILALACSLPSQRCLACPLVTRAPAKAAVDGDVAAIMPLLRQRCAACHSAHSTMMATAPQGLSFDMPAVVQAHARDIYRQVWELKAMPLGNITQMTDSERAAIAHWYQSSSH